MPVFYPVLLCGGSGTRLWPLSRSPIPNSLSSSLARKASIQASAQRLSGPGFVAPTIVTAADFRFIVIEQLTALEIIPANILIEPAAKNTAAAICAAALALEAQEPNALMLVARLITLSQMPNGSKPQLRQRHLQPKPGSW